MLIETNKALNICFIAELIFGTMNTKRSPFPEHGMQFNIKQYLTFA